jgi:PAS domain S-box-containing protein
VTDRSRPPLADRFRTAAGALGTAAAALGASVMLGWLLGLPRLTDWLAAAPEAKFNAGLGVFLLGLSLRVHRREQPSPRSRLAGAVSAALAIGLALLTIGETAFGWDLGIDNLVVREQPGALGALAPGRMALHAAVLFVLVGTALLLLDARSRRGARSANLLGILAAIATLFVAEGYLYGLRFFWGPGAYAYTALPVLVGLVALAIGLLAARPDEGITAVLASAGTGGRLARRLVPVVVLLPLGFGALQVGGVAQGLFAEPFGLALTMSALIAVSGGVVLATSTTVAAKEADEAAARRAKQAAERGLLDALDNLAMLAVGLDAAGAVVYANGHLLQATGYAREEVVGQEWFGRFTPAQPGTLEIFRRGLAEGSLPAHFESPVVTKAGTTLLVAWNNTLLRDASGAVTGTLSIGEDVTAQRAAALAIRENERRLDEIVRAVPFGAHLYELQPDGRLVFTAYSPSAERILHLDHGPLVGKTLEEAFPGNVGTEVPDAYRRVAATGESWSQTQYAYHEGSIAGAFDVRAVNTGPGRLAAFFADITERTKAEAALRESEERFRSFFELTADLVVIADIEGRFREVNPAWTKVLGYSREELLGRPYLAFVHPDDLEATKAVIAEKLRRGETVLAFENRYVRKDGGAVWLDWTSQPNVAEGFTFAIARDVTERKQTEAAVRANEARLRESQRVGRVGSYDLDVAAGVWTSSDVLDEIFGIRAEYPHDVAGWVGIVHPDDQAEMAGYLQAVFASRARFDRQYRIVRVADGAPRWVYGRGELRLDASGSVTRMIGVIQDITEQHDAEVALRELNATLEHRVEQRTTELSAAVRELESFSYSVSHDLRAPLRSIDGFSRILLDEAGPRLEPSAQRYLGLVRKNAQQMGQLVDDLLAFSRLGRQPLRRTRVEPGELVRECLADLAAEYGPQADAVTVEALAPCEADPALLRQVWLNLLANACKFTRDRDPAVIRVGCRDEGGTTVYVVSDNGVGFDMAYADKLFGVFQRLHRAEDYEGTGVGLALVQRIVQRHGGRVWAEAAVDRGATFFFTLGEEKADGREGS